ncbi:MAG: TetR/AcrR family transcriptional regulator [Alphaproteobacteria bacterium]
MPAGEQKAARREAVRGFKRASILEAARRVFHAGGLDGASMRDIAGEAGYTAGALYSYYPGKEHIYADLLADSLAELGRMVRDAAGAGGDPQARARAGCRAFHAFYRDRPMDLDLGLYLFQGIGRRGLTPELDRQLNGRLIGVLRPISEALTGLGCGQETANAETVAVLCHLCGVLLLDHSGRLRVLGQTGEDLVGKYLDEMIARLERGRV